MSTQAAEWLVLLGADSEEERASARAGFEAWKSSDPLHAEAARRIESFLGQVEVLRGEGGQAARPARVALDAVAQQHRKSKRGAQILVALALAVLVTLPAGLALQDHGPAYLLADVRTSTGQWQSSTLADGTRLTLNSASAVNLRYSQGRRSVELVQGEILVDVAHEPDRPFWVTTAQGGVRALGTRFVVRREGDATVLTMLESRARAESAGNTHVVAGPGERVRIRVDGVEMLPPVDPESVTQAWKKHQLVVHDRPLAEVLEELNRHRSGFIRYERKQIEAVKVSAVLPLDDTDRALQLLLTSLPGLRIRTLTPYLVMVDTAPKP